MISGVRRWRLVRAGRDAVPGSLRRFTALSRRRGWRGMLPPVLVAVGLLAVLSAMPVVVYQSSLLAVRDIRVEGVAGPVLSADQVRQATRVAAGTPLASVDLGRVRGRVAALPPVRSVVVDRDWPHTLVVRLVPRSALAAVPVTGGYRLVDGSGVVFGTVPAPPAGAAVVSVARPGPRDDATQGALAVVAALTPQLRAVLLRVEVPKPTGIRLLLSGGRTVVWGDSAASPKKARVVTALLGRPGRVIDVSAPDVVTVS